MAYSINVHLKDGADQAKYDEAKKQVTEQGGKIEEFTLIKGFTATFEDGQAHTLSSDDHIEVERDGTVKTQ